MLALLTLSALALAASAAVASRFFVESRAERALATMVIALAVINASVHVLGWAHELTASALGSLVALVSLLLLVVGVGRTGATRTALALADFVLLPIDAVRVTARDRSPSVFAAILTPLICLASLYLAYLAPSSSWDGNWYHEPMAYWPLQHHGFDIVEIPPVLEWVNGYPRTCENLMIWTVAFGNRRFIDGIPSVMGVLAWVATYLLVRRATTSRSLAIGASSVLILVPAVILQMRSTYIDDTVMATYLATLHFASKGLGTPTAITRKDLWLAALGLSLFAATKSNAPVFASFLMVAALVSVIRACRRQRSLVLLWHALAGLVLVLAIVAPSFVRNVQLHDNPVWPWHIHSETLGIDFPGPHEFGDRQFSLEQNLSEMYAVPVPGQDYHDTRHHAWGYGITFLGIPMLLAALVMLALALASPDPAKRTNVGASSAVFFLAFTWEALSPAHHWARYSVAFVGGALTLIAWAFGRGRWIRFGDGVFFGMFLLNAVTFAWARPGWDVSLADLAALRESSPLERAHVDLGFSVYEPEYLRLRDREFAGELVLFGDDIGFIANLWNEPLTDCVEYLPYEGRDAFLSRLHELSPRWVMMRPGTSAEAAMRAPESGYHPVMLAHDPEAFLFERGPAP